MNDGGPPKPGEATPLIRRRRTRAGAPPGAAAAPTHLPAPEIQVLSWDATSLDEAKGESLADVEHAIDRDRVTWLDVQGLGDADAVRAIGERFGMHRLAVADVLNLGQRPKVDDYDDSLFCVVRMVTIGEALDIHWEQVSVLIRDDVVVTFQERPGDCLKPLRDRIRQGRRVIRRSRGDYVGAMVVDAIVDGYFPLVESWGERLEKLERRVIAHADRPVIAEIYAAKRELLKLRRATWPLRDTLGGVLRDPPPLFAEATLPYVRDTADHVMQIVDIVETYRELAGSFVDVYLSAVGQRTNEVMRVLTVLASIFIPLTFVAGIYGMNFDTRSPWNMPELGWRYGYLAFWAMTLVLAVTLLVVFRRLGWLGGVRESLVDEQVDGD